MKTFIRLLIGCVFIAAAAGYFLVPALKPPFPVPVAAFDKTRAGAVYKCKQVAAPVSGLLFASMYDENDDSRSLVDPDAYKSYKNAVEPLSKFENHVTRLANAYIKSGGRDSSAAYCALKSLRYWADGQALLGETNAQGVAVRKWTLATLSSSYAQISRDPYLDAHEKKTVERWLGAVADRVVGDYSTDTDSPSRRNNRAVGAGWAVAMTGAAVNDRAFFRWGLRKGRDALNAVQPDGTLPEELSRERRALHYHVFTAMPLVLLDRLASANAVDMQSANPAALPALLDLIFTELDDPSYLEGVTGTKQDVSRLYNGNALAFHAALRDPRAGPWVRKYAPLNQKRIGGDAALLYGSVK